MDTSICGYDEKKVYNSEQIAEDLDQHATKSNLQNNSKEISIPNLQQNLQNKISSEIHNNDYQLDHQTFKKVDLKEGNVEDENVIEIENANNQVFVSKQCDVLDEDLGGNFFNEFKAKREKEEYFADSPLKVCAQDSLLSFANDKDEKIIPNLSSNIEILPSSEGQAFKNIILEPQFSLPQDDKIFEFSDQIDINKVEFQNIHVPEKINSSYNDVEVKQKNEEGVETHDIFAEGHIEKNIKYNSKDEIQKDIPRYNESELSEKLDSMIINESNFQVKNEAYQNIQDNFGDEKLGQKGDLKEIKEETIISDNNSKIVSEEKCEESYYKEDEGEKQETEKSEKVLLPPILDGKTSNHKYETEEQEVFENKQSEIKGKNNLVINAISFQEIAETNDMNYRLNPNAKEFIPTSPPDFATLTNNYPIFQQRFDDVVAQSPRKSTINMEDIQVPEEEMFDKEAAIRPHEVNEEIIISEHKPIQCDILCDYKRHSDDECNNTKESLDVFEENMINSSVINSEDANLPVVFTAVQEINRVDKSLSNYIRKSDCGVEKYESDLLNSVQVIPDEDNTKNEKEIASSEEIKIGNEKFNVELKNKSKCPENFQQSIVEEINISCEVEKYESDLLNSVKIIPGEDNTKNEKENGSSEEIKVGNEKFNVELKNKSKCPESIVEEINIPCEVEKYESDLLNSVQVIPGEDITKKEKENSSSEEIKVGNEKFNVELKNKSKCPEKFQQSVVGEINIPCEVEKYESDLLNSVQVIPDEDNTKNQKENGSSEEIKVGNEKFNVELKNKSKCPENFQQSIVEEINIPVKGDCIAEHDGLNLLKFKGHKNKEICAKSKDFAAKPALRTKQVFEKTNIQLGSESSKNGEANKNKGAAISKSPSKKVTPSIKDVNKSKPNLTVSSKPKSNLLATQTKVSMTARPRSTVINSVVEKNTSQSNHLKTKINLKNNSTLLKKETLTASITNNKNVADNTTIRTSVTTKNALLKNGTETKFPVPKSSTNTGKNKINEIPSTLSKTSPIKTGNLKTSLKNPLAIPAKTEANKSVSKPLASRFAVNATKNLGTLKAGNPITNSTVKKDTSQKVDNSMIRKFASSATKTTANTKPNTAVLQPTTKNMKNIKEKTTDTIL